MDIWLFGTKTYEMQRINEELDRLGKKYQIVGWGDLNFPLERYPKYVMILFLDIMRYRDDLIYGLCVLEELTRAGVKLVPPLKGFYSSDKFSNYLLWNKYLKDKIQMPDTLCTINLEKSIKFLKKHKKVIFKPISSSQGIGIKIVETEIQLKELLNEYHVLFLQEIIQDRSYDIRTLIIGDRIVAQYARYNPKKLLKNLHLGAVPRSIVNMSEIDPEIIQYAKISYKITKEIKEIADLSIIGVDMLPSKNGKVYLLEWNSIPGFQGAEEATNTNIAKEIVDFLFID